MKKLGVLPQDADPNCLTPCEFDKFLNTTMEPKHFDALRDILPLSNDLSDEQLMQIAG